MGRLIIYLWRFAVIVFGYAVAALVASAALHLLSLGQIGIGRVEEGSIAAAVLLVSIPFVALFVGYFAFLPSLVAIAGAEIYSQRGWLYHALAGGAVGLVIAVLYMSSKDSRMTGSGPGNVPFDASIPGTTLMAVMVGAGMFGGLAYWIIAGHSAGSWRSAR